MHANTSNWPSSPSSFQRIISRLRVGGGCYDDEDELQTTQIMQHFLPLMRRWAGVTHGKKNSVWKSLGYFKTKLLLTVPKKLQCNFINIKVKLSAVVCFKSRRRRRRVDARNKLRATLRDGSASSCCSISYECTFCIMQRDNWVQVVHSTSKKYCFLYFTKCDTVFFNSVEFKGIWYII